MSKTLAQLLCKAHTPVALTINKLERMSGFDSTDIKLLTDLRNKVRLGILDLGLDPNDTTPSELYYGLLARFARDEQKLFSLLELKNNTSLIFAQSVVEFIKKSDKLPQVFALKPNIAKDLLRTFPPRKLMKALNYRSIDSMVKRESIYTLYAALPIFESDRWLDIFRKKLAKVKPSDFEDRIIEIITMPSGYKFPAVDGATSVLNVAELGVVAVWPNWTSQELGAFGLSLLIAWHISTLKHQSIHIKVHTLEADFGKNFVSLLQKGCGVSPDINHLPVSWETIFRHFSENLKDGYAELFGPHVTNKDLYIPKPNEILAGLSPVFAWWEKFDYAAFNAKKRPVSMNVMDVLVNRSNKRPYVKRSSNYFHHHLWQSLISRYLNYPAVRAFLIDQLVDAGKYANNNLGLEFVSASTPPVYNKVAESING